MKWFVKNKFRHIEIPESISRCDDAIRDLDDIIARANADKQQFLSYKAQELTKANMKYINKRVKICWTTAHGGIETTCYFNGFCVREGHLCIYGNNVTPEHKRSPFVRSWQDLPYDDFSSVKIEII